jgi:hypothetical protein
MYSRLQPSPPAPDRVPTLTEVLDTWQGGRPSVLPVLTEVNDDPVLQMRPPPADVPVVLVAPGAVTEVAGEDGLVLPGSATPTPDGAAEDAAADAALLQRVMAELAPRLDILLEVRLNQMLGPAVTQAVHSLVQGVRQDLSSALQEVASQAVAQVLAQGRALATTGSGGALAGAAPPVAPSPAIGADPRAG